MNLDRIIAVRNNKTIYRDGRQCYKVFNEDYSKADILSEALNQARIEETGLVVPKLLAVTVIEGKWAIVYEYVQGKTLAQLMEESPDKRDEYLEQFVELQLQVQGKNCPMLSRLKDEMAREISQAELPATVRCSLHASLMSMPRHYKVCHGDFRPSNIVIREDGTPCILDWSHASRGNASADAARTYMLFCLNEGRERAEQYLDLFCARSNTEKTYIQKWIPLVAAAYSAKGNAAEREFTRTWIHTAD